MNLKKICVIWRKKSDGKLVRFYAKDLDKTFTLEDALSGAKYFSEQSEAYNIEVSTDKTLIEYAEFGVNDPLKDIHILNAALANLKKEIDELLKASLLGAQKLNSVGETKGTCGQEGGAK